MVLATNVIPAPAFQQIIDLATSLCYWFVFNNHTTVRVRVYIFFGLGDLIGQSRFDVADSLAGPSKIVTLHVDQFVKGLFLKTRMAFSVLSNLVQLKPCRHSNLLLWQRKPSISQKIRCMCPTLSSCLETLISQASPH